MTRREHLARRRRERRVRRVKWVGGVVALAAVFGGLGACSDRYSADGAPQFITSTHDQEVQK